MFGILRYVLAIVVVAGHFMQFSYSGRYSVYIFYIISGLLMTTILATSYKGNTNGYVINRFLRIYPTYFVVLLLTILTVYLIPEVGVNKWPRGLVFPSAEGFLANLLLLKTTLIYPAWSIQVEIFYYLFMVFMVTHERVKVWFWSSLAITVALVSQYGFEELHHSLFAASLPFSMGALLYYQEKRAPNYWLLGSLSAFLLVMFVSEAVGHRIMFKGTAGLYLTLICGFFIIRELKMVRVEGLKKLDNFLGEYSYPIYLSHIIVGAVIVYLGVPRGFMLFLVSLPAIHLVSWMIINFVEHPIEDMRKRFRNLHTFSIPAGMLFLKSEVHPFAKDETKRHTGYF